MGPERAATMMEVRPTVNWTEVATKSDLRTLESSLRAEVRNDIAQSTRLIFFGMLASQATLVGLVFAAARLA